MINSPRTEGKIKRDYGMNDYYKFYKSASKNPVDKTKFNKIISEFNSKIVNLIIEEGLEYRPSLLHFNFCVRKIKYIPYLDDNNKLINNSPIDWKSTKQLWDDSEEAKDKKVVLRFLNNHTSKYVYRIKVTKSGIKYKNKRLYRFKACRSFKRSLAKRIKDEDKDPFNAHLLYQI